MKINFKNILAGVGGMSVLMIIAILGLFGQADYSSDSDLTQNFVSGAEICPFDNYDLYSNYPTPTGSVNKTGTSIYIDSRGKIFSIFNGNNEIETFDKDKGENYKVFADSSKYEEQILNLVGMYIDETRGIVYIPGDNYLKKVYRYDLTGTPLTPAFWDKIFALTIDGYGEYLFVLASDSTGLKKYDLNGNLKKTNPLPYKLDIYPDMAVGQDGTIYVPMNIEKGIFEKNPKTGKPDVLVGYEYVSTILRYDQNLKMIDAKIEDSPFYKRQEKREVKGGVVRKFTEEEKEQTFSRINIDKDGNLILLMKNRLDLDTNGFARSSIFKIYDKNGNLLKEWSALGYQFYDFDSDTDGNIFAVTQGNVYKFITKCGEITIEKFTNPDSLVFFNFSKDFLDKQNFTLQHKGKKTFDIWEPFIDSTTFTVQEEFDSKYDPNVSCADSSGATITNKNIAKIKLNTGNHGAVSCIFNNEAQKGKLIIKKVEQPNTFSKFGFYLVDPLDYVDGVLETFSLENDEEKVFDLDDGKYNVREHITQSYTTHIECTTEGQSFLKPFVEKRQLDPNNPNSGFTDSEVQVYIKRGSITTCIFTNTRINGLKDSTDDSLDSRGEE